VHRLELAPLDPQIARERWIVAADLLDEALGILAPDEPLDSVERFPQPTSSMISTSSSTR
jgi:hypothetical protein